MRNSTLKFCVMLLAFCTSAIHLQAMDEWDGKTIAKGFYSGTGTKTDPYRIFTACQFLYFIQQTKDGNTFSGKYIELCNDIAFSHEAVEGGNFYGDFDGNDHTIQINTDGDESYYWTFCSLYGSMYDVQFVDACNLMSIYTGGILYNCKFQFNGYHGSYTVRLEGGTIANCVSNSAYFKNSNKYGGASGFVDDSYTTNGYCSNCYFPITSLSYGGNTPAPNYSGVIESCGEEAGNSWVLSHTERAYKSWPLTFNPTYPDYNVTITFVDEYGFVSYDAITYLANSTIGELPIPEVDNTFIGWKYNGTYVQSTDVITHDMVLYADWKHEIKVQPTIYEPSVLCNDKEHAIYQWYYQKKLPLQFEDLSIGSSNVEITIPEDSLVLSFDYIAHGYESSGYSGNDKEAWIRVDGKNIVYVYHKKTGSYSCVLSAGTHTITRERSSLSNICISYPTDTLVGETSSALSKQTLMNRPGVYFCKVTYSNNGDELISDYVNYEKLLTIDNVTYVINEDSTATILWVADVVLEITIPETIYYEGVNYPVTSISSKAFVDCTSLASIKCKTLDAPSLLGGSAFEGLTGTFIPSNMTLYVPYGSKTAFMDANGWKDFKEIIEYKVEVESISLDKSTASLIEGETLTLNATVSPDNATDKTVTWSTSDSTIATVNNGLVKAIKVGKVTITAKAGEKTATCEVTVKPVPVSGIVLDKTSVELLEGESITLNATVSPDNATDKTVAWATSDSTIATVDNNGLVKAIKVGKVTITAKAGEKTATCEVIVKPVLVSGIVLDKTEVELLEGDSITLTATVSPDNATDKTVTWATSDSTIATVDNNGLVKAIKVGKVTITAKAGEKTATCEVTVKPVPVSGIVLDKTSVELLEGESITLTAIVSPDNATDKTVIWSTSDSTIATVDNGIVEAIKVGKVIITAMAGEETATCDITVKPIPAEDIVVNVPEGDIAAAVEAEKAKVAKVGKITINLIEGAAYTVNSSIVAPAALVINGNGATVDASALGANMITTDAAEPAEWVTIDSVAVKDVTVKGLGKALFYSAIKNRNIQNFVVDNSVVEVAKDVVVFDFTKGSVAMNFVVKNSTLYAPTATTKSIYSSQSAQKGSDAGATADAPQTFTFENTTLYNLGYNKNLFTHRSASQTWMKYVVKNNVVVNTGKANFMTTINQGQDNKNPQYEVTTNSVGTLVDGVYTDLSESQLVQGNVMGTLVTTNPGFKDAVAGDFTVYAGSEQAKEQIGDPRWLVEYDENLTGIDGINSNVNVLNGDVYSINGIKVRKAGESLKGLAKGLYIVNGKKFIVK